jgi:hypothetical protein
VKTSDFSRCFKYVSLFFSFSIWFVIEIMLQIFWCWRTKIQYLKTENLPSFGCYRRATYKSCLFSTPQKFYFFPFSWYAHS